MNDQDKNLVETNENEAKEPSIAPKTEAKKELKWYQIPRFEISWKAFLLSFAWLGVLIFAIDIITKWIIVKNVGFGNTVEIIPGFFYIAPILNLGSAYGMGDNIPWMRFVFIVISWTATLLIPFFWLKGLWKKDSWINAIFMLCWAGAIGNAIDRTFYWEGTVGFSGVVDFLQIRLGGWVPFGSFNVADASLVIGVLVAVVLIIVREVVNHKKGNRNG